MAHNRRQHDVPDGFMRRRKDAIAQEVNEFMHSGVSLAYVASRFSCATAKLTYSIGPPYYDRHDYRLYA